MTDIRITRLVLISVAVGLAAGVLLMGCASDPRSTAGWKSNPVTSQPVRR